jgi:hypothetical protein
MSAAERGKLVAKAESPPQADNLDEQISSLLESIEIEVTANGPVPVQEEVAAPPPPSKTQSNNRSKPATERPPARKRAKARPKRKARVPKETAPKRKPAPAPASKAVKAQRPAKARAQVQPRARTRPRPRGRLFADPATRELAFFVLAGLMIGVAIGVLVALSG